MTLWTIHIKYQIHIYIFAYILPQVFPLVNGMSKREDHYLVLMSIYKAAKTIKMKYIQIRNIFLFIRFETL